MKRNCLTLIMILFMTIECMAQVGISNINSPPAASAMLDVSSTTSGMLVPRMTFAQRNQIVNPETSLLIFQTDNAPGYYFNAGTPANPDWRKLVTSNELTNSTGGGGGGFTHYIGEMYQGGIVVYVYKDDMGTEHGLIASLIDLPGQISKYSVWSNVTEFTGGGSGYDGLANTLAIITQPGHLYSAAQICDDYSNEGYSDWYLPSAFELNLVYQAGWIVNNVLYGANDKLNGDPGYWSSTEYLNSNAVYLDFLMGPTYMSKSYYNCVRAVRKF